MLNLNFYTDSQILTSFKSFSLLFSNFLVIFSISVVHLRFILRELYSFLYGRGININLTGSIFNSHFFFDRFTILGWQFLLLEKNFYSGIVSRTNIREHKIRLKLVVKNYGNCDTFTLLSFINRIIFEWSNSYSCSDFCWDVWGELDVYLDKLLWRWARRRHPRRPNTWIYLKYWRPFFGTWKFFSVNPINGAVILLRSHSSADYFIYRLPLSLNIYDLFNKKKIDIFFYKKSFNLFHGVFQLLWVRQKGLCFCCKRVFSTINFNNVKVCNIRTSKNYLYNLVLLHSYCSI